MKLKATFKDNPIDTTIVIVLAVLAVALRILPGLRTIDDAYITYRYTLNIVEGVGFVYNPGEAVLGTTTPVYTLLLTLPGMLFGAQGIVNASAIYNALADGVTTVLLFVLARKVLDHRMPGIVLAGLWVVSPRSVSFAVGGMETSVYMMFMTGAFTAWITRNNRLTAVLTAVAVLTRPDALIWAGPLGLAMMVSHWKAHRDAPFRDRLPWAEGGMFAAIIAPWVIYALVVFGSPLPHSIAAKSVAYDLIPAQGLVTFIQHYATPFMEFESFGPPGAMVGAIVYLLLSLVGALHLVKRDGRMLVLAAYPWIYMLVFSLANPLIFRWYLTPPMPMYFMSIVAGVWGPIAQVAGEKRGQWAVAGVGMFWVLVNLNAWVLHPDHGPDRPAPDMAWFELELMYEDAASQLAPVVTEGTVIAAGDIGAVGWYSGARVLDTLGLISPESVPYYPLPKSMMASAAYAVSPDLIMDELPDYIILLEAYARNGLMQDERFLRTYEVIREIDTDLYGSTGMLVWARKNSP